MSFREDWDGSDFKEFEEEGILDQGKWVFYKAEDGKFEATMNGLYMHVFNSLDDMIDRTDDENVYEYDEDLSDGVEGDHFVNDSGEVRVG
jgi:hypothetical protein